MSYYQREPLREFFENVMSLPEGAVQWRRQPAEHAGPRDGDSPTIATLDYEEPLITGENKSYSFSNTFGESEETVVGNRAVTYTLRIESYHGDATDTAELLRLRLSRDVHVRALCDLGYDLAYVSKTIRRGYEDAGNQEISVAEMSVTLNTEISLTEKIEGGDFIDGVTGTVYVTPFEVA